MHETGKSLGREITLRREFGTRLMADCVTGNLDVGGAALLPPEKDVIPAPKDFVGEAEGPEREGVAGS